MPKQGNFNEASTVVLAADRGAYRQKTGRRAVINICPGCGAEDSFTNMVQHIGACPKAAPYIRPGEYLSEMAIYGGPEDGKQYKCPVGCGEWHHYRDMQRHIPFCPKQSALDPYTLAKWRKFLITHRLQPGADIVDERKHEKPRNQEKQKSHASH